MPATSQLTARPDRQARTAHQLLATLKAYGADAARTFKPGTECPNCGALPGYTHASRDHDGTTLPCPGDDDATVTPDRVSWTCEAPRITTALAAVPVLNWDEAKTALAALPVSDYVAENLLFDAWGNGCVIDEHNSLVIVSDPLGDNIVIANRINR